MKLMIGDCEVRIRVKTAFFYFDISGCQICISGNN